MSRKIKFVVLVIVAVLAVPSAVVAATKFTDVVPGAFYSQPVEWAFENGITTGKSATTFEPDSPVTRGEAVTFLKRYHDAFAASGPVLGTPIANGCSIVGLDSGTGWNVTLSFSNPKPGIHDAWIDYALRNSSGVRVDSEFTIIDNVLAGESVSELHVTFFNDAGVTSCDILAIRWM